MNSRCFCWFPAAILVHQKGAPIWRLHKKLYKGALNVSANNSEAVGNKNLRLGQIVYILVFYNISLSWLLPVDGFQFIFLLRDSENDLVANSLYYFFEINKETVEQVNSTGFLGLIIDKELFWKQHIKQVETKISKMLGIVTRFRHYISLY